jgi:diguanylate cyclase
MMRWERESKQIIQCGSDPEQRLIAEIANKALAAMQTCKVPVTPDNYHVWYKYIEGNDEQLNGAINSIKQSDKVFSSGLNKQLHEDFVENGDQFRSLQQAQHQAQSLLKTILDEILSSKDMASAYGNDLTKYSDRLANAEDLEGIQQVAAEIMRETHMMAASSLSLQKRLEEVSTDAEKLKEQLEKVGKDASTDHLTGLHNRRSVDEKAGKLLDQFEKDGMSFSAIMMDIDHFKQFNDTYGHHAGDDVLRILSATLRDFLKGMDMPARYGGEEFLALLPTTTLDETYMVAEKLRELIARKELKVLKTRQNIGSVTVSMGIAEVRREDTLESVIDRADRALYLAKDSGRNNVKSERDLES